MIEWRCHKERWQMKLLIATGNPDKLAEMRALLDGAAQVMTKDQVGLADFDVVEDGETLAANAFKKAQALYEASGLPSVSDDTGLFVDALNGVPGIYAARYAGEGCSYADNRAKLLKALDGLEGEDRSARFKTVVCFVDGFGRAHYFEGVCEGLITTQEVGGAGFGYDSIFKPLEGDGTFAQMDSEAKNAISHRGRALEKFVDYVKASVEK